MKIKLPFAIFCFCFTIFFAKVSFSQGSILDIEDYKHYIVSFNATDNELYKEYIPNNNCWEFLKENIPLFDCPDKMMEQTYYFRWWTYRKHIKNTPDGFVITEFLPDVPWAGKYNTISCPAALHFYEGRWLHNQQYLNDYARFWFRGGGAVRSYSFWVSDALYNQYLVTGDIRTVKELFPDMIRNYESWEKEKEDSTGLFWQIDDRDGMEMSIGGNGYRPTINSYMYAETAAISKIAALLGEKEIAQEYLEKSESLKYLIQGKLWSREKEFFEVLPRTAGAKLCNTRELQGYTPWCFNIPDNKFSVAWKFLMDTTYFYAPFGPTTAEQCDPKFKISYTGHECQWNGPSWPYSTSITLTGLANLLHHYKQDYVSRIDYFKLLKNYTDSHQLKLADGNVVPWIDENLNPFTGDWISRTRLKTWENKTWSKNKGGIERGKDYNHSTFCDLIISGLIGLRAHADNSLVINPLLPDNTWQYFCLDNILYHGKIITVMYDKTGKKYGKGKGFFIFEDGKVIKHSKKIGMIKFKIK